MSNEGTTIPTQTRKLAYKFYAREVLVNVTLIKILSGATSTTMGGRPRSQQPTNNQQTQPQQQNKRNQESAASSLPTQNQSKKSKSTKSNDRDKENYNGPTNVGGTPRNEGIVGSDKANIIVKIKETTSRARRDGNKHGPAEGGSATTTSSLTSSAMYLEHRKLEEEWQQMEGGGGKAGRMMAATADLNQEGVPLRTEFAGRGGKTVAPNRFDTAETKRGDDKDTGNVDSVKKMRQEDFLEWRKNEGLMVTFVNEERNVRKYVRDTLFSKLKFITSDSMLDYIGKSLLANKPMPKYALTFYIFRNGRRALHCQHCVSGPTY